MHDGSTIWGPAMAALTPMQRRFVLAMHAEPLGNATQWAKMAGYSDVADGAKVRAHEVAHNPKVRAAIEESSRAMMGYMGPLLGVSVMLKIAGDPTHKDQLKAAIALCNRVGFHELSEHVLHVQHSDKTGAAMIERIKELAGELGLDAAKLLGANAPQPMKVIEHARTRDSEVSGAGEAHAGLGNTDAGQVVGGTDA